MKVVTCRWKPFFAWVVVIVVMSANADAQKKSKPKNVKKKDVASLSVLVDGSAEATSLLPGTPVKVDVVVIDKKGRMYSLSDGTLGTKHLRIIPLHALYEPEGRMLTPLNDPAGMGKAPYSLSVEYGGPPKKGKFVEATRIFRADYAALLGPNPADVRELHVAVDGRSDQTFLVPGKPVGLSVVAVDATGREYRTGNSVPKLPMERLRLEADWMAWDPASSLLIPEKDVVAGKAYRLTVSYEGRADLKREITYQPDFAAVLGPEPEDVTSLELVVGGLTPHELINPGSKVSLSVEVRDKSGRIYRYPPDGGPAVPHERLRVETTHLDWDAASGALATNRDCRKMSTEEYAITVSYQGRDDLRRAARFGPDFIAMLDSRILRADKVAAAGASGSPGASGEEGSWGAHGRDAMDKYGRGGDGSAGGGGRAGRTGRQGGKGPRIAVKATEVMTLHEDRLMLLELRVDRDEPKYVLRPMDAPALSLVSSGGRGGDGGAGGAGGPGGNGGSGYSTGDGGTGGPGGNGGNGGNGGPGGQVSLVVSDEALFGQFLLEAPGGPGGRGGAPGSAGEGGEPGSAIMAGILGGLSAWSAGMSGEVLPPQSIGEQGYDGELGYEGMPGAEGPVGSIDRQEGDEALGLLSRLPNELAACLVNVDAATDSHED